MPKQKPRKNYKRDNRRLEEYLKTKCYICYERKQEPSIGVPCCNKRIHESCLQRGFDNAYNPGDYRCPFCRQILAPYNEPFQPNIQGGGIPIAFIHQEVNPPRFPVFHNEEWDWEQQPPPPPPPPGWAEEMQRIRNYYIEHPRPIPEGVIFRPG